MLASQRVLSSDRWSLAHGSRGQRLVHEKKTRRRRGGAVAATAAGVGRGVWEGGHWPSDEHKSICGGASTPGGDTLRGVASAIQGAALQGASVECVARAPISSRIAAEDYDTREVARMALGDVQYLSTRVCSAARWRRQARERYPLCHWLRRTAQLTNSQNFSVSPIKTVERQTRCAPHFAWLCSSQPAALSRSDP